MGGSRSPAPCGEIFTVFKIADTLKSEHIRRLPVEIKRSSVLLALEAATRERERMQTYDQVPRMHGSIAMVKANATLLERNGCKYRADLNDLATKVKASIQTGRDDLAGHFAVQFENMPEGLARSMLGGVRLSDYAHNKAFFGSGRRVRLQQRHGHGAGHVPRAAANQ